MADHSFNFDNTYINLPKVFYTELSPTPVRKPEMVIFNTPVAENMGLNFSGISAQAKMINNKLSINSFKGPVDNSRDTNRKGGGW